MLQQNSTLWLTRVKMLEGCDENVGDIIFRMMSSRSSPAWLVTIHVNTSPTTSLSMLIVSAASCARSEPFLSHCIQLPGPPKCMHVNTAASSTSYTSSSETIETLPSGDTVKLFNYTVKVQDTYKDILQLHDVCLLLHSPKKFIRHECFRWPALKPWENSVTMMGA